MRTLPVYLTPEEVERLIGAASSARDRLLIFLLWVTGGRVSEVIQARWGDLTETGIRLPNLKQGRSGLVEKHVFLPEPVLRRLREEAQGRDPAAPIFLGARGRPISRWRAWQIVREAARRAGLFRRKRSAPEGHPIWPHVLRHSYAVHLLRQGLPITLVQRQLGHRTLSSTQVYTQIADVHAEEMVKRLDMGGVRWR